MNKILIKNIYYMLSYAFIYIVPKEKDKIATEDFENIHDLFAAIIHQGVAKQIKQGLYREYINKSENLNTVRGNINIQKTMANCISNKKIIHCDYDILSENNIFNQIIKSALILLIKSNRVDVKYKKMLKKDIMYFSDIDLIDLSAIKWKRLNFTRNNKSYRMIISICQFLVEGLLISSEKGEYKLRKFVDDQRMSRLFEKFVLKYYKKEYSDIKVSSSQIPWAIDDDFKEMLPVMQSDIMLEKNKNILIIDTKYYSTNTQKRFEKSTIISGNLYQIFTYVKNKQNLVYKENKKVSGILLYARTTDQINIENDYFMSGNKIGVRVLDLNQDFISIRKTLDKIAKELG